jgi:hypothetical protein
LFKGELSIEDIMDGMPKKRLLALRDARVERLQQEERALKQEQELQQKQAIRDTIMQK